MLSHNGVPNKYIISIQHIHTNTLIQSGKPLSDLSSDQIINRNHSAAPKKKKRKSFLSNPIDNNKDKDTLSNPFKTALNISSNSNMNNNNNESDNNQNEDDDLKKALQFDSNTTSIMSTPTNHNKSSSNLPSLSPSPGVIRNKKNIPSPQRISTISLRSFHTTNHVEFYKPIPISQSRSTQFEIINETYNHKSIQIKKKHTHTNLPSVIDISPSALNLKRYDRALITVTCRPTHAMRIKEIIRIEWDLHSIEVHIHAIGFHKSSKFLNQRNNKGTKGRKQRKRSLKLMRKEDSERCESVQSSLESSKSGSLQNSAMKLRRMQRQRNKKSKLSPTIRRTKAFTAAPFSSPAPNKKLQKKFEFDENMKENDLGFTPNIFKKRRLIDLKCEQERKRLDFESALVKNSVVPIQTLFRCYLAQKSVKKQIRTKQKTERQKYYFGVIKCQIMTKRVRKMYQKYQNAANILSLSMQSYVAKKQCFEYIHDQRQRKEAEIERLRVEKERFIAMQNAASVYVQQWFRGSMYRREFLHHLDQKRKFWAMQCAAAEYIQSFIKMCIQRSEFLYGLKMRKSSIVIQSVFKTYLFRTQYAKKQNAINCIQSFVRCKLWRFQYLNILQSIKEEKERKIAQEKRECVAGVLRLWQLHKFGQMILAKNRLITMRNDAVVCIQSFVKTCMLRNEYLYRLNEKKQFIAMQNEAANYIQRWFKTAMYRREFIRHFVQKQQFVAMQNNAANYIQTWFQSSMHRRDFLQFLEQKRRFLALQNKAAHFIQCWFKTTMYRREFVLHLVEKQRFIAMQNAASVYIQQWFRGSMYRREFLHHLVQKRKFLAMQSAATEYIQSFIKMYMQRSEFLYRLNQRKQFIAMQNDAANYIQCWLKSMIHRSKFIKFVNEKRRRIAIQNEAAMFIQCWFKTAMYRREYVNFCKYSNDEYTQQMIACQALIRGKLQRIKCQKEGGKLLQLLKNVKNANSNWKRENSVNYLLQCALNKLNKSRTLYGVSEACDTLQNLLKIVPNLSNRIVEHDIIGTLYNVLRNSNRSLPHLTLVNKILHFFIFFAKHDIKSYEAIFYRDDTLDILSERLQIHRLDFVLFELTTQLFFIGVDIDLSETNKFLINLRQSDVNRQIRTVHKIMCSKLEIAKRVNKPLRKMKNAKIKYKVKFKQEQTLSKCVQNMTKLVDKM